MDNQSDNPYLGEVLEALLGQRRCSHEVQLQQVMGILAYLVDKAGGEMVITNDDLAKMVIPDDPKNRKALMLDTSSEPGLLVMKLLSLEEAKALADSGKVNVTGPRPEDDLPAPNAPTSGRLQ